MKTTISNCPSPPNSRSPSPFGTWAAATFATLLLATSQAAAAPVVTTLTGGPSEANPKFYGYVDGDTKALAQFHTPMGLAIDSSGSHLLVADRDNNAIRILDLAGNLTATFDLHGTALNKPIGVALDVFNDIFVLDQGDATLLVFNNFGELLASNAVGGTPGGIALDSAGNVYVTSNNGSPSVLRIAPPWTNSPVTIATVSMGGSVLQGLAVLASGSLAVCDSGNNGIWLVNPSTGASTPLTGFHGAGDRFGTAGFSQFNSPFGVAEAGGGMLVVTDYGNNRVKSVDPLGSVTNLYAVSSNFWVQGSASDGIFPGWWDGTVCQADTFGCVEARLPAGVVVAPDGTVYTTEDYYHLIRHVTSTGLASPGSSAVGGTNVVVATPTISPSSGYYPMGVLVTVTSPNQNVFFTTDGTEPTTNSTRVTMIGNVGTIHYFNSTNDLTGLKVKAFVGTNASATVSGQPVSNNDIGVPIGPSSSGLIYAGIGSTIVVPVVSDLRTNDQVKSYQFRVEVTPNGAASAIPAGYNALGVSTNDFVALTAAVQGQSVVSYTIGSTRGLQVSAIGNSGNIFFKNFAVVALLKVPIPPTANQGDTYSVSVSYPSATSDGTSTSVSLTPMGAATILVTNVPYTVGDSASASGTWYNAGTFGDGDLVNADVNNAFYAALGLRVPYAFSDVFNAMDAYPPDVSGFVGGDGQIRFLDWQLILLRSLHLPPYTNNWAREWSTGGTLINTSTNLRTAQPLYKSPHPLVASPWYRQALIGASSVGYGGPGGSVSVPVYVKMADGATLSGLQFRAVVTPLNGAPPIPQALQLTLAPGTPTPAMEQSFQPGSTAFGWSLGAFNFQSRSSNFLGWLTFPISIGASSGQQYQVSFANADGAPDLNTQYTFETRSAYVAINGPATPASICSDEWKLQFFGSLTAASAADLADPDGDGVLNWMEYIAGTDPTDATSRLRFTGTDKSLVNSQPQVVIHWLTAPGRAYEVQWASSPVGGAWNTLGTVSGDGTVAAYTDNASGSARFYRLRVLP